jgi:hypothetical protein
MEMPAFSANAAWESPRRARINLIFLPKVCFMACPVMFTIKTYNAGIDKTQFGLYYIEQLVFQAFFRILGGN